MLIVVEWLVLYDMIIVACIDDFAPSSAQYPSNIYI